MLCVSNALGHSIIFYISKTYKHFLDTLTDLWIFLNDNYDIIVTVLVLSAFFVLFLVIIASYQDTILNYFIQVACFLIHWGLNHLRNERQRHKMQLAINGHQVKLLCFIIIIYLHNNFFSVLILSLVVIT